MSSYTIELGFILRNMIPELRDNPDRYMPPNLVIEKSKHLFFDMLKPFEFNVFEDEELNKKFYDNFIHTFCLYFYEHEINAQVVDSFYLKLASYMQRKLPIYTRMWPVILDNLFVTEAGTSGGSNTGTSTGHSHVHGVGDSDTIGDTTNNSNTNASSDVTALGAQADTPQNELDMNVENLDYASGVSVQKTQSNSNSTTEAAGHSETKAHTVQDTISDSFNQNNSSSKNTRSSRSKDVFTIYTQWVNSGFDLFTPMFKEILQGEEIFLRLY